jgi:HemY protein
MKSLILLFVTLTIGAITALFIRKDSGYVIMGYSGWSVEMSLWLFALFFVVTAFILHYLLRSLHALRKTPKNLGRWQEQRKHVHANKALNTGLLAQAEGNWKKAEKKLVTRARDSDDPMINYLAAARSAQAQGANDRRDHYLQLAHKVAPNSEFAVELTQAELQMADEQLEQALASLLHLRQLDPKNAHVIGLLCTLYQKLGDWEKLSQLLGDIESQKVITGDAFKRLEKRTYRKLLQSKHLLSDNIALHNAWQRMPKRLRGDTELLIMYVNRMIELGQTDDVERLIREQLRRHWDSSLVRLYGIIESSDDQNLLSYAEGWLKQHNDDAMLLLSLGRICMRLQLWGKARSYLESSIGLQDNPEAYQALAEILEQVGEANEAAQYYRSGLNIATRKSKMPIPTSPA